MITLKPGEEIIRETKPHSTSFLGSPNFWVGIIIVIFGVYWGINVNNIFSILTSMVIGLIIIIFSYIRRVAAYKFYITNKRIISNYKFIRKLYREISYDEIIDIVIQKGLFAKMFGYADIWLFGYRKEWIVGRMRGVRFGDCVIITNKAWKTRK